MDLDLICLIYIYNKYTKLDRCIATLWTLILLIRHNPNLGKQRRKDRGKGFKPILIKIKKYYACGKPGYFIRDYQLNIIYRDKILAIITKQFNITIKEYPIEALDEESKP